jgi:hypothetical protein
VNLEEHLKKRGMLLKDLALRDLRNTELAIEDAYRTGYNDGYLQRAEDVDENKTAKPRPVQPGANVRGRYPPAPGINDGTRPMRRN